MRSIIVGFGCLLVVGCGGFGAASPDDSSAASGSDPAGSPPASNNTPADNAKGGTPVGGEAPRGVFVSASSGSDAGSGSQDHPLKSLAKAIMLAHEKNLPVNACAEIYEEQLTVGDGVSMYGYFDCSVSPWARGTVRATVKSPTSPALVAEHLAFATRIEGFDFRAPDGTASDPTSIGARIISSKNLTISQALVHAGSGADGTDGAAPAVPANSFTVAAAASGEGSGTCPNSAGIGACPGPAGGTNACSVGTPGGPGGQAGDGRWYSSGNEFTSVPWDFRGRGGNASTAAGGDNSTSDGAGNGKWGSNGVSGPDGPDGANGQWQLSKSGFVPGDATAGGAGTVGQGGGGGGGTKGFKAITKPSAFNAYTSAGGAGGAGGCAGQAGGAGRGGGASIGAFVIDSELTLEQAQIESAAGGAAGAGSLGTDGTAGQAGGSQFVFYVTGINGPITGAGAGGNGGRGGVGGASGHGAPGPSIALAFSGTRPTLTSTDLTPGPAGRGQPELRRTTSSGDKVLPAVMGLSEAEHTIE